MIYELTDENYTQTVTEHEGVIFIDFYSPSCGPCQELLPLLPVLQNNVGNDVLITKVNVTQNPKLAQKYGISSVPLCVSIGADKMVKQAEIGARSLGQYIKMIEKAQQSSTKKSSGFLEKMKGLFARS